MSIFTGLCRVRKRQGDPSSARWLRLKRLRRASHTLLVTNVGRPWTPYRDILLFILWQSSADFLAPLGWAALVLEVSRAELGWFLEVFQRLQALIIHLLLVGIVFHASLTRLFRLPLLHFI